MANFEKPAFLDEETLEAIHRRMLASLPDDMDVSEGSHPWNLTMPSAYEIAQLTEYVLPEAIKMIFPQFCENYGEILDYHAQARGMERKAAQYATGSVTITGDAGAEIPAGSIFSTVSSGDVASVDFETTEACTIGVDGTAKAEIRAVEAGNEGNVGANTIILNSDAVDGISSLTNPTATAGGMDEESNEDLQARIVGDDQNNEVSYGGTAYDYKRWAEEVSGVGSATIISPEDDTGVIEIVLVDANGEPASAELCTKVYDHIMSPDNPADRLAPINDQVAVTQPETVTVTVAASVSLTAASTLEGLKESLKAALEDYATEARELGIIKYSKVGAVIASQSEVDDYTGLLLNGATVNVSAGAGKHIVFDISGVTAA